MTVLGESVRLEPTKFTEFDEVLESCRRFLLAVAVEAIPIDLRAKGGASDLVQQTLANAVQSRQQFRGNSLVELRAWLRAILLSEAAIFRRRFTQTAARDVSREVPLDGTISQLSLTPIEAALQGERDQNLSAALMQLSHDQHQAVALRMEGELSFSEIGTRLGRSEEAARKLFTRALQQLRGRLAEGQGDHE